MLFDSIMGLNLEINFESFSIHMSLVAAAFEDVQQDFGSISRAFNETMCFCHCCSLLVNRIDA